MDDASDAGSVAAALPPAAPVAPAAAQFNPDNQQVRDERVDVNAGANVSVDESGLLVTARFVNFLQEFHQAGPASPGTDGEDDGTPTDGESYSYLTQLQMMIERDGSTLFVDFDHVASFDWELKEAIEFETYRFDPFLRQGLTQFVSANFKEYGESAAKDRQQFFVSIYNMPEIITIRRLRTDKIGQLSSITGTVTRSSDVRPELLSGTFRCGKCGNCCENVEQQFIFTPPSMCNNPRCDNMTDFTLETDKSIFVDWQRLRVQENSEEIPPGSMPRSTEIIVRSEVVESAKAGDKCTFTGYMAVVPDSSGLARAGETAQTSKGGKNQEGNGVRGLKALGVRELTYKTCFIASSVIPVSTRTAKTTRPEDSIAANAVAGNKAEQAAMEFTMEEREDIRRMKGSADLYSKLVNSVAPNVFGHQEVKRGVLLMLFGGVHKTTQEGIKLRGDINVCIVGDPSTAKSQFLKYVHSFMPRAVYTSGKASSAAGLTASVLRDTETGEYVIEAGALMLADNGICCIDEFDKMDPGDQVAIHESMEQQTISITKAGIQATLNARASILAAANPVWGRYDRSKTLKANVNLSAPLLSRFDLFFVVLDDNDDLHDYNVARHIIDVHCGRETQVKAPFSTAQLQRYIKFGRSLNPSITEESKKVLVSCYTRLRQGDTLGRNRTAYRITVRQLESMVRLSEALARLHCDDVVRPQYIREAFRLLRQSIVHVETDDVTFEDDEEEEEKVPDKVEGVEEDRMGEFSAAAAVDEAVEAAGMDVVNEETEEGWVKVDEVQKLPTVPDEEPVTQQQQQQQQEKKKRPKTKIGFEQFQKISNALATMIRSREEKKEPVTWKAAVEWFLQQEEQNIGDDVEELGRLKSLANSVIKKLIKSDGVLVYLGEAEEGLGKEDRIIGVHPNYSLE